MAPDPALPSHDRIRVDVHATPEDLRSALLDEARTGLTAHAKWTSPKFLYDDVGSELFDAITEQPEYYLTCAEVEILEQHGAEIAAATGAERLIELGSGTSRKTRLLLDALDVAGTLRSFVPFDVSETTLRDAAGTIASEYPTIGVHAVVGDFHEHLGELPTDGRSLVAFLGSTIGNLLPAERAALLDSLGGALDDDDHVLLGVDLVKDVARLEAAYDDAAGVSAAFARNVVVVVNRELGADFDPDAFDYDARFVPEHSWIEMSLRARRAMDVRVDLLDLDVRFEAGERLHTEVSTKFTHDQVVAELDAAGFAAVQWWTDAREDFEVVVARRTS